MQQQQQPYFSAYPKQQDDALNPPIPASYAPVHPPVIVPIATQIQRQQQPQDFVLWSFFNSLFLNFCCLGFVAFSYSIKSRDRKGVGDVESAASYGKTARALNIAALTLGILMWIAVIVILVTSGFLRTM